MNAELCITCGKVQETKHVQHDTWEEWLCAVCGAQVDCMWSHCFNDDVYYDLEEDPEEDAFDAAVQECGLLPPHLGGGCTLGGTEHCDFECPFRDHPEWLLGEDENEE